MTTDRMIRAALAMAASFGILLALFGALGAKANDEWTYKQTVDDFTDETESKALSPELSGRPYIYAGLRVGCDKSQADKGSVSSWVNLGYFNNWGFSDRMDIRFDNDEPKRVGIDEWSGTKGFSFSPRCSSGYCMTLPQFIQELIRKDRLRISTEYYNSGTVVLDFSLTGAADAINKVVDDCDAWDWLEEKRWATPSVAGEAKPIAELKAAARKRFCENGEINLPLGGTTCR